MLSRRQVLKGLAALSLGTASFGGYAIAEPFRLGVTRYRVTPARWPAGLKLRLALIADIHACERWMPAERIRQIVARTNALAPDATLLLGDYVVGRRLSRLSRPVPHEVWGDALGGLSAPLGVHAVLGNHDWWEADDPASGASGSDRVRRALEGNGIRVYENDAVRIAKDGTPFWLAGLGDQWAFGPRNPRAPFDEWGGDYDGVDDLAGTLARVTDDAPVVLMAHEPDIFPDVPDRVALTVAGHTHGGQVRIGGYAPFIPSRYGSRYLYGHIEEEARHLIVSGGLGCSGFPIRFGSPPEIVLVDVAAEMA